MKIKAADRLAAFCSCAQSGEARMCREATVVDSGRIECAAMRRAVAVIERVGGRTANHPALTAAERADIVERRRAGQSIGMIVAEARRSQATVNRVLRASGMTVNLDLSPEQRRAIGDRLTAARAARVRKAAP